MPRDTHPIAHSDRSCKLKIAPAPQLLLISRGRFGELEEPFDPLQCEIFLLPLPSHRVESNRFLNTTGNFK